VLPVHRHVSSGPATIEESVAACDRALFDCGDRTKDHHGHGPLSNKAELKVYRDMLDNDIGGA